MKKSSISASITIGGAIGMIASFLELIEYQDLLKNAHAALACNLNSVFSCSPVLNAWQSRVFGFPNAMLCLIFFSLMLTAGIVGWTGGTIKRELRLVFEGLALFFICFGSWFMWQSLYRIGSLCILCLFCYAGLLMINWGWLRWNVPGSHTISSHSWLGRRIATGCDTLFWVIVGAVLALMIILKFY